MFGDDYEEVEHEDSTLEVVAEDIFFQKLESIGLTDLDDTQKQSLIKVLSKPNITGKVLVRDLTIILENFGIKDQEDTETKREKKKYNYDDLQPKTIRFLCMFTDYLLETDTSVYEYFDGLIYN